MAPVLEQMAQRAITRRIELLDLRVKKLFYICGQLASALYHHSQDRHDVTMKTDDSQDVRAIQNARRALADDPERRGRDMAEAGKRAAAPASGQRR